MNALEDSRSQTYDISTHSLLPVGSHPQTHLPSMKISNRTSDVGGETDPETPGKRSVLLSDERPQVA